MMIFTIAGRELRNMFLSPLAWVILAIMEMIFAILFMADVIEYLQQPRADGVTRFIVSPLFGWAAILLIFVIPLLTMRLISEERRNKTLALLFSAPITMTEIILGKYLGIVMYLLIMVLAMLLLPMSLMFSSSLDFGMIATSVLGLVLLLCSIAAIGLFMSTLTQSPALAAIMAFGAVFLLLIFEAIANWLDNPVTAYISIFRHYLPFVEGVFDTADALYYVLIIVVFLVLSIRRLDLDRVGG